MGASYAGILGPLAMFAQLLRALISGGSAANVLPIAIGSLFAFALVGYILGSIAETSVIESVKRQFEQELNRSE